MTNTNLREYCMYPVGSSAYSFAWSSSSSSSASASTPPKRGIKHKREEDEELNEPESKELSAKRQKFQSDAPLTAPPPPNALIPQKLVQTGGLCEDTWIKILQYLPGKELYATWTRVDKYFNQLAPQLVTSYDISWWCASLSTILKGLQKSPLSKISIEDPFGYSSADLFLLKQFPLTSLTIGENVKFDASLSFGEVLNQDTIHTLFIWKTVPSEMTIKSLQPFALKSLYLHDVNLQNSSLAFFPPTLERLSLAANKSITSLATLNTLKLKELRLVGCPVTDVGMKRLKKFTSLEVLDLSGCRPVSEGIKWITKLQIRTLSLASTQVSDNHLPFVPKSVTGLSLRFCTITNEGMKHLSVLSLTALDLSYISTIDDFGIEELSKQPSLEMLNLNSTNISDKAIANLGRLSALRLLDIGFCKITVTSLLHLIPLPLSKLVLPETLAKTLKEYKAVLDPTMKTLVDKLVDYVCCHFKFIL